MNRNFVIPVIILLSMTALFACRPAPTPTATATVAPTQTPDPTSTPIPSITGRVTDVLTGQGIADALVEVGQVDCCGTEIYTMTDTDGRYALFGLSNGEYRVRASAPDYAREYWNNVTPSDEATTVNIRSGTAVTNIDFVLTEGGSISGHIYELDGETPVAEADVFIRPGNYRSDEGFWAVTDAEGSYTVEGLPLGDYKITVEAPGYARLRYYNGAEGVYDWLNGENVMVIPPAAITDININLHKGASVSGTVYQSDGITPFVNAHVNAEAQQLPLEGFDTNSNSDGHFILEGLPPGNFIFAANAPGFATRWYDAQATSCHPDRVNLSEGESVADMTFMLETAVPLRGHVYDEAGKPIPSFQVVAGFGSCEGTPANITISDNAGAYELWLGAGDYFISFGGEGHPDYIMGWYDGAYRTEDATLVHVEAPDGTSGIDYYAAKSGSISGVIYEADGITPIVSANVYAVPTTGNHPGSSANTGEDGRYTIASLPSGSYHVQATVSGHVAMYYNNVLDMASATKVQVNAPNETLDINFLLDRLSE